MPAKTSRAAPRSSLGDSFPYFTEVTRPEIVFGLVGAVGTDMDGMVSALASALSSFDYRSEEIHVSHLMHNIEARPWSNLAAPNLWAEERYHRYMDAGTALREKLNRGDALVMLSVGKMRNLRMQANQTTNRPLRATAFILRSLKHPDEVKTLRSIYGNSFHLIGVHSPRCRRLENLTRRIAESHHAFQSEQYRDRAEALILKDEAEQARPLGQAVRDTFHLSDVFVDSSDGPKLQSSLARFIQALFGYPYHTPTRDETGMFHAYAAALRSAAMGRQVGAAIATAEGDIVVVGSNEVAKACGGLYWCGDVPDNRDFVLGYDISDKLKTRLLADVLSRLKNFGWIARRYGKEPVLTLVDKLLYGEHRAEMKASQLMNIIEFGRCVHAEMAAICDAARRGVPVNGCTLFTTTFPCHECARHIVAAGIRRVAYVEPYPKSLVLELYSDSIALSNDGNAEPRVAFEPFIGVAPRRFSELFQMGTRKTKDGKVIETSLLESGPRLTEEWFVVNAREMMAFGEFRAEMKNQQRARRKKPRRRRPSAAGNGTGSA